jgi:hypothetical protein
MYSAAPYLPDFQPITKRFYLGPRAPVFRSFPLRFSRFRFVSLLCQYVIASVITSCQRVMSLCHYNILTNLLFYTKPIRYHLDNIYVKRNK